MTTTASAAGASAMSTFNDADVMFAQMMIEHHRQAIAMAELATTRAGNADAKALAENIVTDQQAEIATMQGLLGQL